MSRPVEVRGARATVGETEALRGVDLALGDGELLAVLGPSGSGKTTLLRAIAGFLPLDAGTISLAGVAASDPAVRVPPSRRGVGMVFQSLALWPHLTAAGHLDFVLRGRGLTASDRRARTAALLDLVRLSGKERRRPSELSGGEAQRLALARALAGEPRVLLLDEPLGSVDEALRADLGEEIRALQKRLALPTIHVTHDQEEGLRVADRVAVLREGRVEQVGTPETVYREPATAFVARFVGRHNLVAGTAIDSRIETPLGDFPAPASTSGPVVVALPHDALAFGDRGAEGRVSAVAFEAGVWTHRVRCGDLELALVDSRAHAIGEVVRVRVAGKGRVLPAGP